VSWLQYVLVGLLLAGAVALIMWRERVKTGTGDFVSFLGDVKSEVLKITWPSREELRKATMVILAFVVVVAIIIGTMDLVLQWLLVRLPGRA
jgi:preprotein translocase subunit SecE